MSKLGTLKIVNAKLVNEGQIKTCVLLIKGNFIERIAESLSNYQSDAIFDAQGKHLLPGLIDDQV
ncbi:MAG: hypothetical protein ACO3JH_08050, partial [Flavobacteriaceae bacterium]